MRGVLEDIKSTFRFRNNQINQLVVVNLFAFLIPTVLVFLLGFLQDGQQLQTSFKSYYFQSSNFFEFLTHSWTLLLFPVSNYSIIALVFNTLGIFWFGNILSDFLGGRKTLSIYLGGAIFALFFYFFVFGIFLRFYNTERYLTRYLYGASAGVYALLFGACALLPNYEMLFLKFFIKLRYIAFFFLFLSYLVPIYGVLNSGGAVFGYLSIKWLHTNQSLIRPIEFFLIWFENFGKERNSSFEDRKAPVTSREAMVHSANNSSVENSPPEQDEIDNLLDKINLMGYENLTREEKERLFKASQKKD